MSQWYLDIVKYAPEMLKELDGLKQWPNAVKESQRGWIGQEIGKLIPGKLSSSNLPIEVFVPDRDLDKLAHTQFLAISSDISLEERLQFLTPD